jgi:3-keto-disaccharide hydrolase
MKKAYLLIAVALLTSCWYANGQAVTVPFTSDQWNKEGTQSSVETYLGKECLLLKSGIVFIKELQLQDGTIEADISFPQQRGFPGLSFRMQDKYNSEHFYVRPHQSGNPDATQYTPVFNRSAGWQLYHGEGYSKAIPFTFDQWHHIKIDVHGRQAEIYFDDMQTPLIKVTELKRDPKAGTIALDGGGIPTRFANLQYTIKQPVVQAAMPVPVNGTDGLITKWQVSNQEVQKLFADKKQLTPDLKSKFTWTVQNSEPSGTLNLAKFTQPKDTGNVMIAKVIIESDMEQVKAISFGFSDYLMLFLNDKALYSGRDAFMSRDYRFLGTIGFFDMIFLPLKKGKNELWFVVAEDFGGWGVKAKLENMKNISLP